MIHFHATVSLGRCRFISLGCFCYLDVCQLQLVVSVCRCVNLCNCRYIYRFVNIYIYTDLYTSKNQSRISMVEKCKYIFIIFSTNFEKRISYMTYWWTKHSKPEEKICMTPPSCAWHVMLGGLIYFVHPSPPLGRRKRLWNLGGVGGKVVQGLNILSIYGTSYLHPNLATSRRVYLDVPGS